MIKQHRDEFGYYWFDILDLNADRRIACTARYTDRDVARREAVALEKFYQERTPTPEIQVDLDPIGVSTGNIHGPMGEYYGTLKNASPEFRLRLTKAVNGHDEAVRLIKQTEAYSSLNMATPPPLETTQNLVIALRAWLEKYA